MKALAAAGGALFLVAGLFSIAAVLHRGATS